MFQNLTDEAVHSISDSDSDLETLCVSGCTHLTDASLVSLGKRCFLVPWINYQSQCVNGKISRSCFVSTERPLIAQFCLCTCRSGMSRVEDTGSGRLLTVHRQWLPGSHTRTYHCFGITNDRGPNCSNKRKRPCDAQLACGRIAVESRSYVCVKGPAEVSIAFTWSFES